jgi:arylsulfatase A-like enzyme
MQILSLSRVKVLFPILLLLANSDITFAVKQSPNIVLILSDDQAWTDYGFMGHEDIETPNLDRLASRSRVFRRGYVASPLCRPSLASMVTGLFPFDHGVTGNDVDGRNNREKLDIPVQEQFHQHPSFIKDLVKNGYLAHQSGKWWEGSHFDGGFTHGMKLNGRHGSGESLSIGRKGIESIKSFVDLSLNDEKPFFIWYAPFLPHTPHNPPERLLEKYRKPGRAMDVAKYYAMCDWFDETCGELINHLDKKEIRDNTMILYICDNGWTAKSVNAEDPNQKMWNGFSIRSKGSPYENGIRTPIMVSWLGVSETGESDAFAHAIDLYPTIAAAAGINPPSNLPGINLLDKKAVRKRDTVYGVTHAIHNMTVRDPDDSLQYLWCIENEWKLIIRYQGNDTTKYKNIHIWDTAPYRLYNLKKDPHEKNDLAASQPEIVERLKKKINDWHSVKTKNSLKRKRTN